MELNHYSLPPLFCFLLKNQKLELHKKMSKLTFKHVTQRVTIDTSTAAGLRDFSFTLDNEFSHATEMYMIERNNGGDASDYRVGVRQEGGLQIREIMPKEAYQSQTNIAIADRYVPLGNSLEAKGRKVVVSVETYDETSDELSFDIVYKLENLAENC